MDSRGPLTQQGRSWSGAGVPFLIVALSVLSAQPSFAAKASAPKVSLGSLPNFVFTDDRMEIVVQVSRRANRPVHVPATTNLYPAEITFSGSGRDKKTTLAVPPYRDMSLPVPFGVDFRRLGHGSELVFTAFFTRQPKFKESHAVLLQSVNRPGPEVRLVMDHFEDETGRRVIFLVPRPDDVSHRRWYPVRSMRRLAGQELRKSLLVGAPYGNALYAEELGRILASSEEPFTQEITESSLLPVFSLLLSARLHLDTDARTVFIFPGIEDIRMGTPTSEYYMALQAISAVFDQPPSLTRQVLLATPPPQGDLARGEHYRSIALQVARERHIHAVDLRAVSDADETAPTIDDKVPSQEAQKRIAACLTQGRRLPRAAVSSLIPVAGFLFVSIAMFWLCGYARYRAPSGLRAPRRTPDA